MAYTFKKRVGPTTYDQVKNLKYYVSPLNPSGFSVNPKTGGNCTWWAWGRFLEVMAVAGKSLEWSYGAGNACMFYDIMTAGGLSGGLIPKPGAIICWGYNNSPHGNPGHVAFVEQVNIKNGEVESIEISQSGYSSGPLENKTIKKGTGKKGSGYDFGYNNSYFNGFIYNPVDFGNPAGIVTGTNSKDKEWYISKYGTGALVYFELIGYGYSHTACCAVLGNMQQESGIRVYTGGSFDGNGSEGLCQWTFGRKTAMMEYAAKHSTSHSWQSVDGQVAYLVHELETTEKAANKVLKDTSLSLKDMTIGFEEKFERADPKYANLDARVKYAKEWDTRMKGADSAGESTYSSEESSGTSFANMQRRASRLYSSDNYEYLHSDDEESKSEQEKYIDDYTKKIKNFIHNYSFSPLKKSSSALPEMIVGIPPEKGTREKNIKAKANFSLSKSLVQAPFVELNIGGHIVGSYRGDLDSYPNYISKLDVKKINGEINQYTIGMVYQIRPGEDPNLLDRLFSKVRYSKIHIRYGDCESGSLFKDTEAIITNIVTNRDYSNSRINYTIYATSACNYVTSIKFNFKATVDKPSNVIRDLLYNNAETSKLLLDVFSGMRDISEVERQNLIPNNDTVLNIEAKTNIDVISYINYLVGCMSNVVNGAYSVVSDVATGITTGLSSAANTVVEGVWNLTPTAVQNGLTDIVNNFTNNTDTISSAIINGADIIRSSLYFITYLDDSDDGAYFKINEVQSSDSTGSRLTNNVFEITVGYPDGNDVYDFKVNTNNAWAMLYNKSSVSSEYIYGIDDTGKTTLTYSPNLVNSSNILNEIQKNWWTQMVKYPISAQLTMRGLLKPISLMDYIKIDVMFYGQKHLTSGLYVITGEQDILSGSGFLTNLSLLRVGD